MAYSESLALRIRLILAQRRGIVEKKMFGGLCFLLGGNLLVGVWKNSLIARLGPDQAATARQAPHVRPFDITGKPMKAWVLIEPDGIESDVDLSEWIELATEFVGTLPSK